MTSNPLPELHAAKEDDAHRVTNALKGHHSIVPESPTSSPHPSPPIAAHPTLPHDAEEGAPDTEEAEEEENVYIQANEEFLSSPLLLRAQLRSSPTSLVNQPSGAEASNAVGSAVQDISADVKAVPASDEPTSMVDTSVRIQPNEEITSSSPLRSRLELRSRVPTIAYTRTRPLHPAERVGYEVIDPSDDAELVESIPVIIETLPPPNLLRTRNPHSSFPVRPRHEDEVETQHSLHENQAERSGYQVVLPPDTIQCAKSIQAIVEEIPPQMPHPAIPNVIPNSPAIPDEPFAGPSNEVPKKTKKTRTKRGYNQVLIYQPIRPPPSLIHPASPPPPILASPPPPLSSGSHLEHAIHAKSSAAANADASEDEDVDVEVAREGIYSEVHLPTPLGDLGPSPLCTILDQVEGEATGRPPLSLDPLFALASSIAPTSTSVAAADDHPSRENLAEAPSPRDVVSEGVVESITKGLEAPEAVEEDASPTGYTQLLTTVPYISFPPIGPLPISCPITASDSSRSVERSLPLELPTASEAKAVDRSSYPGLDAAYSITAPESQILQDARRVHDHLLPSARDESQAAGRVGPLPHSTSHTRGISEDRSTGGDSRSAADLSAAYSLEVGPDERAGEGGQSVESTSGYTQFLTSIGYVSLPPTLPPPPVPSIPTPTSPPPQAADAPIAAIISKVGGHDAAAKEVASSPPLPSTSITQAASRPQRVEPSLSRGPDNDRLKDIVSDSEGEEEPDAKEAKDLDETIPISIWSPSPRTRPHGSSPSPASQSFRPLTPPTQDVAPTSDPVEASASASVYPVLPGTSQPGRLPEQTREVERRCTSHLALPLASPNHSTRTRLSLNSSSHALQASHSGYSPFLSTDPGLDFATPAVPPAISPDASKAQLATTFAATGPSGSKSMYRNALSVREDTHGDDMGASQNSEERDASSMRSDDAPWDTSSHHPPPSSSMPYPTKLKNKDMPSFLVTGTQAETQVETQETGYTESFSASMNADSERSIHNFPQFTFNPSAITPLASLFPPPPSQAPAHHPLNVHGNLRPRPAAVNEDEDIDLGVGAGGRGGGAKKRSLIVAVLDWMGPEYITIKKGASTGMKIARMSMTIGDDSHVPSFDSETRGTGTVMEIVVWRETAEEWCEMGIKKGDVVLLESTSSHTLLKVFD